MSFLGSIEYLMAGSGLQEALELVFAPNAVIHMLSGKACDRAVRGHFLVDAALNALLTADAFQLPWILIHHDAKNEPEDSQGHITEVTDDHNTPDGSSDEEVIETTGNRAADIEPDNLQTQAFSEAETVSDDNLSHPAFSEARVSTGDDDLDVAAAFLEKVLDGDILPEKNVLESLSRISTKLQKHKNTCQTAGQEDCGSSTWRWWPFFGDQLKLREQETLSSTCKALRTCCPTLLPLGTTTTSSLPGCTFNRCA